jgi:pimeloyl-ACP methyl ester carboxylesterase
MGSEAIETIEVNAAGWTFECDVAGTRGAELVLLLHGFPQTSYTYRRELPALARAGFFAVAPLQRGYSKGARPSTLAEYATEHLTADALAVADHFGAWRFHLVGHDWGGQLAWLIASQHPERLHSLCVLSRPHPEAFKASFQHDREQATRSRHHKAFQAPDAARKLLADDAARLRTLFREQGVRDLDARAYLSKLSDEAALDAAINWYRSAGSGQSPLVLAEVPPIDTPTLYIWGDADATVGRAAAAGTQRCVTGPFQFLVIEGAGHFLTDEVGPRVTDAIVQHIQRYRAAEPVR